MLKINNMSLSKSKQEFTINKIIEFIDKCNTYELSKLTYSSTFKFKSDSWNTVKVEYSSNVLEKVEIETNGGTISLSNEKSLQKRFEDIDKSVIKRATELDNIKFLKIFPDYTAVEERDYKLAELLGDESIEETPVNVKPIEETPVNIKPVGERIYNYFKYR